MKNKILVFLFASLLTACTQKTNTNTETSNTTTDSTRANAASISTERKIPAGISAASASLILASFTHALAPSGDLTNWNAGCRSHYSHCES